MTTDITTPPSRPIAPIRWGDANKFWEGLGEGELRLPQCPDTGRLIFPPTPTSPWGQRRRPNWITVNARGTVWSFIVAHPPLVGAFADLAPYVSAVVELDEWPATRLPGAVVAAPGAPIGSVRGDDVRIGMPVALDFTTPTDGAPMILRWIPA